MLKKDVEKYQNKFAWLKDSKFLQELENDSVDSEILEEELTALQEEEILTSRQKLVKCLQSNPVQVLLCVVVLLDAGIVIAQILLDLHSVRDKLAQRESTISELLHYIRKTSSDALHGYEGDDVHYILQMLHDHDRWVHSNYSHHHHSAASSPTSGTPSPSSLPPGIHHDSRFARQSAPLPGDVITTSETAAPYAGRGSDQQQHRSRVLRQSALWPAHAQSKPHSASAYKAPFRGAADHRHMQNSRSGGIPDSHQRSPPSVPVHSPLPSRSQPSKYMQSEQTAISNRMAGAAHNSQLHSNMQSSLFDSGQYNYVGQSRISANQSSKECAECLERHRVFHESEHVPEHRPVQHEEHDTLHEVAHGLHFASIALLGFLVLEDLIKMCAMGRSFFKHKIEIFDAIIIISSFLFDIIFLGGVTGEEGEKAAAVLVVLLLWRITRVVDGILITAKQRQEFRIRLQKRARRRMEKRIDILEDERHNKSRQITALKDLCAKAGVNEDTIEQCTPKRKETGPRRVSHTMCALSSVAKLSVSMTMSMSSGLFSMADEDDRDKDSAKSGEGDDKLSIEYYTSGGRRHSLPNPMSKMSDIDEESMSGMRDDLYGSDSPINSSGIRIIIDEGSELNLAPNEIDLSEKIAQSAREEEEGASGGSTQVVVEPSPSTASSPVVIQGSANAKQAPEQTKIVIEEVEMDDMSHDQSHDPLHDHSSDILLGRESPDSDIMDDDRRMSRISNCPLIV